MSDYLARATAISLDHVANNGRLDATPCGHKDRAGAICHRPRIYLIDRRREGAACALHLEAAKDTGLRAHAARIKAKRDAKKSRLATAGGAANV